MTEPHRFTSIMNCLKYIVRQIVQQTPSYSEGQIYVLPLLMSVLPGIDLNDFEKTSVTLEFLDIMFMVITCVDCSSAVNTRNDLTEVRFKLISKIE
jgi:proteasome activator subunit 4